MKIFVAGGSGTIGIPLTRALVGAGHEVVATTRSAGKQHVIREVGGTPAVVDALDSAALEDAVVSAAPAVVIHQLTALPRSGVRRPGDLEPTNRLRDEGTRNLLAAAMSAGARRFIAGSFAMLGAAPAAPGARAWSRRAAEAVRSMESQVLDAALRGQIEGIVLRYGLFYGSNTPTTVGMIDSVRRRRLPILRGDRGRLPFVHLDDAVSATVAAIDRGRPGRVYDIVDDRPASFSETIAEMADLAGAPRPFAVPAWLVNIVSPYLSGMVAFRTPISNTLARQELAWAPRYRSYREGLREAIRPDTSSIRTRMETSARLHDS